MEHAAVKSAEVELAYDYGHVDIVRQAVVFCAVTVTIIAGDIAEF